VKRELTSSKADGPGLSCQQTNLTQTCAKLAKSKIELMLADLDLGSALMEAFHISRVATTKARTVASALQAYEIVAAKTLSVTMSPENDTNIRSRLKSLAHQLTKAGERI
jgi:hypothetical protein